MAQYGAEAEPRREGVEAKRGGSGGAEAEPRQTTPREEEERRYSGGTAEGKCSRGGSVEEELNCCRICPPGTLRLSTIACSV